MKQWPMALALLVLAHGCDSDARTSRDSDGSMASGATCTQVCDRTAACLGEPLPECASSCAGFSDTCRSCLASADCAPNACAAECAAAGVSDGGMDSRTSQPDSSTPQSDSSATTDSGQAPPDSTPSCDTNRTFACADATCTLAQICFVDLGGTGSCHDLGAGNECTPCSTQLSDAPECPMFYPKSIRGSPDMGCTAGCE